MPLTDATHDLESRTLTITAEFAATVERVWQVYADASQLAQVWGPPGYPATFDAHSLKPGGRMHYYMTSPEGEKYYGFWAVTSVDEPNSFAFEDGFALNDTYATNPALPVSENEYRFAEIDGGTRLTAVSRFATAEALQQVLDMGVIEGSTGAINQIDGLLAAS